MGKRASTKPDPYNKTVWIPSTCLELVDGPLWAAAVIEYHRWCDELQCEQQERLERWRRELQEVADKYKLTVQQVRDIAIALEFNGAIYE